MLKRIIASAVMATATQATRAGRSQRPRRVRAGGEVRVLILPFTQLCSLVPSRTQALYSITVSQSLRQPLRGGRVRTIVPDAEQFNSMCYRASSGRAEGTGLWSSAREVG